jgi:hypothetical protein
VDDGDALGEVVPFSGVYNGDHWQITLAEGSDRPPFSTVSNTIKKLRLAGQIESNEMFISSLALFLDDGTLSEVGSTVEIESLHEENPIIGGLVVAVSGSSLIQYSYYAGQISLAVEQPVDGLFAAGLVGFATDLPVIRDSYARAHIRYNSDLVQGTGDLGGGSVGGIVGLYVENAGNQLTLLRTYAAGSFEDLCPEECNDVDRGGLIGFVGYAGETLRYDLISSFWPLTMSDRSIGAFNNDGTPLGDSSTGGYESPSGLPRDVPLTDADLRRITTFQSKGAGGSYSRPSEPSQTGVPDPSRSLTVASSTETLAEQDYRWAIESADVDTFVAQKRTASPSQTGETVTFTRAFDRLLWTNSAVPTATYSTRGVSETVDGYPALGRVWEICDAENDGFPVLVWEDRNCPGEETGGGVTNSGTNQAHASGLSGEELAAFLASGLTLEQWLAQRLAATGTPGEALGLGVAIAGVLTIVGLSLLFLRRRSNVDPA